MAHDDTLTLTVEHEPSVEALEDLVRGLKAYNRAQVGESGSRTLAVFLRSPEGTLVGGALGYTLWDWLFVSHLWVDERVRGRDWGTRLLAGLEAAARERGCDKAHLDTFSFQALGFYEKRGYARFGTLPDYPKGHSRYFLWKHLTA